MKTIVAFGGFNRRFVNTQISLSYPAIGRWISTSSDDYQFLQKSKLPMLHFQSSLPHLPVPPLEKSCHRYLDAQRPLLTDEQYKNTEGFVRSFQEKEGKALQDELVALNKRSNHTSYISQPWFEMYLRDRSPVVINVNPFMGLADDPKAGYNDQLIRASNILISSLRFLRSLRANVLEPEVYHLNPAKSDTPAFRTIMRIIPSRVSWYGAFLFKAFPLDMSQYQGLFNSTRIPQQGQDELLRDPKANHMLVLRNGNFYVFDVLDKNGHIKDPSYIQSCLNQVLTDNRGKVEFPVASLTTMDRDSAADARQHLLDAGNAEVLRLIDTAIFSMSLDDEAMNEDPQLMVRTMLHGDGTNRWFDKSLQMAITKDGKAAINFEHSWGDGVAVLRYMNEVFKDSTRKAFVHPNSKPANIDSSTVQCLEFRYTPEIKQDIQNAIKKHQAVASRLQFNILQYEKFGKNFIKKHKLSPDAIMQLAFQMGYYKRNGKAVASYESCSTAAFLHGRTETIRPATIATKKCSEAFTKKDKSAAELRSLISECSKIHGALTKDAAMGNGFDRHLFMLRLLAEAHSGQKLPDLFADPAYKAINQNIISTSTLSSEAMQIAAFGPVVPNGLGIGYGVNDNDLGALISSYPALSDADGFTECLQSSLDDIYEVLLKTAGS